MFRVVHISDLHFTADLHQPRVVDALCADLERVQATAPIHAVVFSGDAAAKGKTGKDEVEAIVAQFVSHVRRAVGSDVPVLICPGNHDIDLSKRSEMFGPVFADVNSPDKANSLVEKAISPDAKPLWAHIEGFRSLASAIDKDAYSQHPLYYTKKISASGIIIGFACLNSAWMTKGGGRGDYGQLYVGEHVLALALKELDSVDVRIAVMHHPLDWLAPEEKARIQRFLTLNFQAFLCGHKHDNNAETLNSNVGNLFTSNTGCIYQSNEYFNGYSTIDIDLTGNKWVLNAREYYFQREVFDVATRFATNGYWESPFTSNKTSTQIAIPSEVIRAVNDRANSLLLSYASDVAPKSIGAMFVEPPLSTMSEKELIAKTKGEAVPKGAYESLTTLGQKVEAIFFIGKREAGKSLLLHHIAVNKYQSFNSIARIGVVVDINATKKATEAALLEQAVEFCGGEIPRRDVVKLLSAGEVVMCFDNVKMHDQRGVDLIRDFILKYPKVRYIFAASEELLDGLSGNKIPDFGIAIIKIYVHSFRARHTKELVQRWFGSGDLTLNKRVVNINQLFDRLRVPRTPFLVSVLSWVLEQKPNANVVNRASAIEVLIEGLLGKFNESKTRKGIDSTIQQHFLAEFALHLNVLDQDFIPRLDFDGFVFDYFKKRGLNVSTDGFAMDLIKKGLLYATDDRAGFKFDCFRAFFLAKKFAETPELWKAALDPDAVSRYGTELDLFTGLHRDRSEVLRMAKELCTKTYQALEIEFPLHEIDRIGKEHLLLNQKLLTRMETEILSDKKALKEPDLETPDIVSADHEEARKRRRLPDMGDVGRYLESLRVFSMILRNSELVNDLPLKRESFELAMEQWANTTITVILEMIEKVDQEAFHAIPDNFAAEKTKEVEIVALSKAMITQMIIAVMCDSLASPKLELFVREKTNDPRTLVRVLAVALSFEAGDEQAIGMGKALLKDARNNGFVLEILFFKLLGIYLLNNRDEGDLKLRDFLGDIMVQLRGGTARDAAMMKSRFLGTIDKNLLVKEFVQQSSS